MDLILAEEFILLSLKDESGKWAADESILDNAVPGALLIDLFHRGKLTLENKKVIIVDTVPTGHPQLDEAFSLIQENKKLRTPEYWVDRLANKMKKLPERLLGRLVEKGIVKIESGKVLWLFKVKHYPTVNPAPELEIRKRLDSIVLHGNQPDAHMAALISLAYICELVNELFEKEDRKEAKKRMKQIMKETDAAAPVAKAIQEVQAAILAAVAISIMAAMASTASS